MNMQGSHIASTCVALACVAGLMCAVGFSLACAASVIASTHALGACSVSYLTMESVAALKRRFAAAAPLVVLSALAPVVLPTLPCLLLCIVIGICNRSLLVAVPPPRISRLLLPGRVLAGPCEPAAEQAVAEPAAPLRGQLIIVTGSSAGIGLETAQQLLARGATVIFACRSERRAEQAAAAACRAEGIPRERAIVCVLDTSDLVSVRVFAAEYVAKHKRCDGLVLNAGCMLPSRKTSPQGYEMMLSTNHLGHFLLTQLLMPMLRANRSRVIFVSSALHKAVGTHDTARLFASLLNDPQTTEGYEMFHAYAKSKLAQVSTALELHKREGGAGVISVSLHPGSAKTEVTRSLPLAVRLPYALLQPLLRLFFPEPAEAAFTTVQALIAANATALAGTYLERCSVEPLSTAASSPICGRALWDLSERLVATFSEPLLVPPCQ
mmetsp:Transcript_40388/g.94254  ORF Transcript_40388/g.94254 Transcript_40388/m.94254 type:complete len:439 (-) Transcript_40388:256-1572(-)